MDAFLTALASFPVNLLGVLMGIAVLYWLLVVAGLLGIDLIPFDHDHAGDPGHNPNLVAEWLRLGRVPLTIVLSILVAAAWLLALTASLLLAPWLTAWPGWLAGALVLLGSLLGALLLTGLAVRPLARVFALADAPDARSLIGLPVEVTSSTVDARFGTARHDRVGGDQIMLNVVCAPHHRLRKGDQAVVMDLDPATGVATIAPLPHTRPGFLAEPPAAPDPAAPAVPAAARPPIAQ